MEGLKFEYLSFDKIAEEYKGISVWIDGKEVACGFISDVLIELSKMENPHLSPPASAGGGSLWHTEFALPP